jgi:hypothetical protein
MAITESDDERQARIAADIRRLFARYRRVQDRPLDGSQHAGEDASAAQRSTGGRFGSKARPDRSASRGTPPRAL